MKRIVLLAAAIGVLSILNTLADVVAPNSMSGRALIRTMTSPKSERVIVSFDASSFVDSLGGFGTYTFTNTDASHCVLVMTQQEPGDNNGDVSTLDLAFKTDHSGNITGRVAYADGGSKPLIGTFTIDVTPPMLTITSPKPGLHLSSGVFTAIGTAKDNVAVGSVFYKLNSGDWMPAGTTNSWKNWSATNLTLLVGTNVFSTYAVDTSTNYSVTNTVQFEYVVTNTLRVQIVGNGILAPNYSGKALAINNTYTMKAVSAAGFAFAYWDNGVPMSTNRTLTFTMSTNLAILATFEDVARPANLIMFPTVNKQWANPVITVTGKAHDNVGVSSVWVQINTNDWVEAGTTNGFQNWSATNLTVISGTNLVRTFALDAAGNVSLTNQIKFFGALAPNSISGFSVQLTSKSTWTMTFGSNTYSATMLPGSNPDQNTVGYYSYTKLSPTTAQLALMRIAPPSLADTVSNIGTLTFSAANRATYLGTNQDGTTRTASMTFLEARHFAPDSLAGSTYKFSHSGGYSIVGFANGSCGLTSSDGSIESGDYIFTPYSPVGGMLIITVHQPGGSGRQSRLCSPDVLVGQCRKRLRVEV